MNQRQKPKILLMLSSLENRITENESFFIEIFIAVKSGNKQITGTVKKSTGGFQLTFGSIKKEGAFDDVISAAVDEVLKYDEASIVYKERGTWITITANDKNVSSKMSQPDEKFTAAHSSSVLPQRDYYLKIGQADELLKEIGILTSDGKLKNDMIRKYNQIDHFIEVTEDVLTSLPNDRVINVVDCACGKSYLSFALNFYMRDILKLKCRFVGIDISENVVNESWKTAARLGYANMEFIQADLSLYVPDFPVDVVVSLHACDTATDMALILALKSNAKAILCVPCCHRELLDKYKMEGYEPLLKNGVFRARMNDLLTDSLRL